MPTGANYTAWLDAVKTLGSVLLDIVYTECVYIIILPDLQNKIKKGNNTKTKAENAVLVLYYTDHFKIFFFLIRYRNFLVFH